MEINEFIEKFTKEHVKRVDNFIEESYEKTFNESVYYPGTKIITEKARKILEKHELKIINEEFVYENDCYRYTAEYEMKRKGDGKMTIIECGYCDNTLSPKNVDGDLVCSRCGAEWADARCEREMTKWEIKEMEEYEKENNDF